MHELLVSEVNTAVILQQEDGYLYATGLCKENGKLFADYFRLSTTQDFLNMVMVMGIPMSKLVVVRRGGRGAKAILGTWVHPDIAVNLGQWCSPDTVVAVSQLVNKWRRGELVILAPGYSIPQTLGEALMLAGQEMLELERQEQVTLAVAKRSVAQQFELKA